LAMHIHNGVNSRLQIEDIEKGDVEQYLDLLPGTSI